MAAISTGTYMLVSAVSGSSSETGSTAKCLDVCGASDRSGANVHLWTLGYTDAQFWHAWDDGDYLQLCCVLSGKCLDVTGALADGVNVIQYADRNTVGQRWKPVADGGSITVDGVAYDTYVMECKADDSFCLDVTAASSATGTNVQVYSANGSDAQRWAFVPVEGLPDGTYTIRTGMSQDMCLDVAGGSSANGANIQIYGANDTNAQVFVASTDRQTGLTTLTNAGSGKMLRWDASGEGDTPQDGDNVSQWAADGSMTKRFMAQPQDELLRTNGNRVMSWLLRAASAQGDAYCVDVAGGSTKVQTNVQLWAANGTLAQRFEFRRAEALGANLSVPSDAMLLRGGGMTSSSMVNVGEPNGDGSYTTSYLPTVVNSSNQLQMRYRMHLHAAGDISDETVTGWMSARDGSTANDGWGDVGMPNVEAERVEGQRWKSPFPIEVTLGVASGQYMHAVIELQARTFREAWTNPDATNVTCPAHGATMTAKLKCKWRPTATFSQAAMAFDGIWLPVECDYPRGSGTCSVTMLGADGAAVFPGHSESGLADDDTLKVPWSECSRVPDDGEIVTVQWTWTTPEGGTASGEQQVAISYDTSHGLSVSPTLTYDASTHSVLAAFAAAAETSCKLQWDDGGITRLVDAELVSQGSSQVVYRLLPPVGVAYRVLCFAYDSDSSWGSHDDEMEALDAAGYLWNWGEDGFASLTCRVGEPLATDSSFTPESAEQVTSGRARPVYVFGRTVKHPLVAHGTIKAADGTAGQSLAAFEQLANSGPDGHAVTFRDHRGGWHRVAVTQVDMPLEYDRKTEVTVTMAEVG